MRQTINPQMQLGEVDISAITFNLRSGKSGREIWDTHNFSHIKAKDEFMDDEFMDVL